MAIYHLSVKPISRADGRSATAAAAYRAGELVHDERAQQTFDYTRKRGVEHKEIVLPSSAALRDINWARDRQTLWNAAEAAENRSNSRVAREYELALPHELGREERVELVRAFASEIANRHGVAVDFAIHKPHRSGDTRNHHAHLMATTRVIEATGLGDKSTIEWSDTDRRKAGLEPAKMEIKAIRERWAVLTNEHLREQGLKVRVDHRSLKGQGINREPTTHLGAAVNGMERRGIETDVGNRLREERRQIAAVQVQERVVMRERRELAPLAIEAPAEDQAALAREIERDRRVQLERAALFAERRVERRREALLTAAPEQLSLFVRLVGQAQALKRRLGVALERVKDWVRERFNSGLERTVEPEKASATPEIEAGKAAARERFEHWKAERAAQAQRAVERERAAAAELKARQAFEAKKSIVAEKLISMASSRAAERFGWGDRGDHWQSCSPTLQKLVDTLARAKDASDQKRVLDRALDKPGVMDRLQDEITDYQKDYRSRDRGYSR